MYDWIQQLINLPSGADPVVTSAASFMVVMLFILACDIFVNSLFGLFRRRK